MATSRKIVQHITRGFVVAGVAAWPCLAMAKTTVPLPKPRPQAANAKLQDTKPQEANAQNTKQDIKPKIQDSVPAVARPTIASLGPSLPGTLSPPPSVAAPAKPSTKRNVPFTVAPTTTTSEQDVTTLARIAELIDDGKPADATQAAASLSDPVARKLAEWLVLRSSGNGASAERYRAFFTSNPDWPGLSGFRRRGEAALWDDARDDNTVFAFFGGSSPLSAKGKLVLARALLGRGDKNAAERLVRQAWRNDGMSADLESAVIDRFGALLTPGDHKARMDYLLYQEETNAAMRMAQRIGGHALALAKARVAVINEGGNAGKLLDAVPAEARHDPGYIFSRAQWLRRTDKIEEAGKVMTGAPRETARAVNPDEWWQERRLIARKLLDAGNTALAYQVARDGPRPDREVYQADQAFTAGWIALRFLHEPSVALQHFTQIPQEAMHNPAAQSRAGYWMGRASDALGRTQDAQRAYQSAAQHSTSYYGQLARAKLGLPQLALNAQPRSRGGERLEVVRAMELLYAIDQRDLLVPILTELAQQTDNMDALVALAELTVRNKDARGTLIVGKGALNRGLPFDAFAFPVSGVPAFKQVGPEVEDSLVYSIARQESMFNPKAISVAKAMGLMQVMPATGRQLARKYSVPYDQKRMMSDGAYNASLGAAMLGELVANYRGSYILTSVGYNAGPGRVREWVQKYGDPRDPKVDAVDWVERIPFSETRNYVQRIVENMQVYRARFGGDHRLMIEADLRRGTAAQE